MKDFQRIMGWFELRHNGLIHPIVNLLFLWDAHCVIALERWQTRWGPATRQWFASLGDVEALSALAGWTYDNPEYAFPTLDAAKTVFIAEELAHPLLPKHDRVGNDVSLDGAGATLLVTGSNMSGKSTLLRSMGMACTLALSGAPVCARSLTISPFHPHTSLRISDSLNEGVSHFYAELLKLRRTLEAARDLKPTLFLLG